MTAGNVNNAGTVTGSYSLGNGGVFVNTGTLNAGSSLVAGQLLNTGNIRIGALAPYDVSRVSQASSSNPAAACCTTPTSPTAAPTPLLVRGAANLAGRVRPVISSVLPNIELPVVVVNGPVTGGLEGEDSTLFRYSVDLGAAPSRSRPAAPISRRPAIIWPATTAPRPGICSPPGRPVAAGSARSSRSWATPPMPGARWPIARRCGRSLPRQQPGVGRARRGGRAGLRQRR